MISPAGLLSLITIVYFHRWHWRWQDCSLGLDHTMCIFKEAQENCSFEETLETTELEVVNLINEFRGKVSRGEVQLDGTNIPSSARMVEIRYDENVALVALRWAQQCINQTMDFNRNDPRFNMTQYVYTTTIEKNEDPRRAKNGGFNDGFFNSIFQKITNVTKNDIEHPRKEMWGSKYNFTPGATLMYGSIKVIGCAHAWRDEGEFYLHKYVCNFGPFNAPNDPSIYQIGKSCSACFKNETCNTAGLCVPPGEEEEDITY